MSTIGGLLIGAGILLMLLAFGYSAAPPGATTLNLGLLVDKLLIGFGAGFAFLSGVTLIAADHIIRAVQSANTTGPGLDDLPVKGARAAASNAERWRNS